MLTKSQAKAFFLIGTAGFSLAFVILTIDTFRRIPSQTNSENLTESAIRGKHLFERKNCMGCHTILGEGAYYAPELTKVIERRGEVFVSEVLKDPQKMFPGQRQMTNFKLSDQEVQDLVQFLKWIGNMNLNGFPPRPDMVLGVRTIKSRPVTFEKLCSVCHSLGGAGGNVGPALDGIGSRWTEDQIKKWLEDPFAVRPNSQMPKLPLSQEQITELSVFLATQKIGVSQ